MLLKILFLAYNFYINPHVPADIIKVFCFDFRFSRRKSQNQKKTINKDHLFYNTGLLKTPHSFYEPQLT